MVSSQRPNGAKSAANGVKSAAKWCQVTDRGSCCGEVETGGKQAATASGSGKRQASGRKSLRHSAGASVGLSASSEVVGVGCCKVTGEDGQPVQLHQCLPIRKFLATNFRRLSLAALIQLLFSAWGK
eukprot:jgi/Botrbrau1/1865/Bobra.146_1s0052.1